MNRSGWIYCIVLFVLLSTYCFQPVQACKDIIACGDATDGDYNLLLKVRDPSRQGYQVLTIIPKGYKYEYQHPWTGKPIQFETSHKIIGVTSKGDTIPEIVKAGMCFTDSGLAFGDADTVSNWKNPTKYKWDDFDWIRFAAQSADSETEAVRLLTEEAVDTLHAPGVPENLFVVGPNSCYVIEADVIHYDVQQVDDILYMSNYAKNLWRKSIFYRAIAPSFDSTFEGMVRKGKTVRLGLGSIFGVRIIDVGSDYIEVKQIPIQFSKGNIQGRQFNLFGSTRIELHETKKVDFYSVTLDEIDGNKAEITMSFEYKKWEELLGNIIRPKLGSISVVDLMNWSRLHSSDLEGLRGMCDSNEAFQYEGDMIFKIPKYDFDLRSEGWFSANHPCSSIYVPVHICNDEFFEPYETGEAAEISLNLLKSFGHDRFSDVFHKTELVFINEIARYDSIFQAMSDSEISSFLTLSDIGMQKQAFLTQEYWLDYYDSSYPIDEYYLSSIWNATYSSTLNQMKYTVLDLNEDSIFPEIIEDILEIASSIVETRIEMCSSLNSSITEAQDLLNLGFESFKDESFEEGFNYLIEAYVFCDSVIFNEINISSLQKENNDSSDESFIILLGLIFIVILSFISIGIMLKNKEKGKKKKDLDC